ncbi:MAG: thiamine-phosphate kinase [Planctomycetota bacterium]
MSESEFGYIKWIQKHLKYNRLASSPTTSRSGDVLIGSGDDCAVIKLPDSNLLYATTDTIVEGVDFNLRSATPEQVGYKSVAISLSDLAAMGGGFSKIYALISASLPKKLTKSSFTHPLFQGMSRISKQFGVRIIGGDISSTKGPITITSTLLGISRGLKPIRRSGACIGDAILVTGKLGGSILGKHLSFIPRLEESELLNRHYKLNSMIDISDGLLADLNHILETSPPKADLPKVQGCKKKTTSDKIGAMLDEVSIPISLDAYKLSRKNGNKALRHAFSDGEDFELLFTAPMEEAVKIIHDKRFNKIPISIIGLIWEQKGIFWCNRNGKVIKIKPEGFRHF